MRLSTHDGTLPDALPVWRRRLLAFGGAVLISAALGWPQNLPAAEEHACGVDEKPAKASTAKSGASNASSPATAEILPDKPSPAGTPAARSQLLKDKSAADGRGLRRLVTYRGEIVDYYCYIEKGARGPGHRDCGVKCVAGDVCMGLLTTDDRLMMISINHMRAMEPLAWRDVPDPFAACRSLIAEQVDLTGYYMERKGQRIIEVTAVKPVVKAAAIGR